MKETFFSTACVALLIFSASANLACEDDGLGVLPDGGVVAKPDALPPADAGPTADAAAADAATPDGAAPDAFTSDAQPGCTDGGLTASSTTVTSSPYLLSGTTTATAAGEFVVRGQNGQELRGTVAVDSNGEYAVDIPLFCGMQTIEVSWPGTCVPGVSVTIDHQQCSPPDIQVSMTWDDLGRDFELHLIKPGGRINDNATDCTWTSCISTSPDWGVAGDPTDDPHKDVDNTGGFGPENIYLHGPETGRYWVLVEHWGAGAPEADGNVAITLLGMPTVNIPITDLTSHFVRYVATIDWPARTVTTSTIVFDCTAQWSGGCTAPIP